MTKGFIEKMRKKLDLSQDFLSSEIGVSRPTYVKIENGEQSLTIPQAQKLAGIFNITLNDLISGIDDSPKVEIKESSKEESPKNDVRIILDRPKIDKFKEVLLYILNKVGGKPNVGQSVLNKLLYFIDFDYYEKYEEQLIGAHYIRNHYGPTPVELIKVVDDMKVKGEIIEVKNKFFKFDQKKFLPLRKPNLENLTAREIEHIDDVLCRLSDKTANEIKNYSHDDIPWKIHKDGERIDYESVFYRDEKYSVRSYDDEL
jgi:transcriptional regulator with XRE-family HTH domain